MLIQKLDPTGVVIESIELADCFKEKSYGRYIIWINGERYHLSDRFIDKVEVDLKSMQQNFCDNMRMKP